MAIVMATCSNCGRTEEKSRTRRGQCAACRGWERKHGTKRPIELERRNRNTPNKCSNCGCHTPGKRTNIRGLCIRCYRYKWRTGEDRPVKEKERTSTICRRCKQKQATCMGRCDACYRYILRHGVERPKAKFTTKCMNCKRPLVKAGVRTKRANYCNGLCMACYRYQLEHGKPRPKRLIEKQLDNSYGFCECGKPATHKTSIQIHDHVEELPLCDDCYAIEQQHNTWYGDGPGKAWKSGKTMWGDD